MKLFRSAVVRGILLGTLVVLTAGSAFARCGKLRWDVKTVKDDDWQSIDFAHPIASTIKELNQVPRPDDEVDKNTPRTPPTETKVFTVRATLREAKWESNPHSGDNDYHLVLEDEDGNTMVAEIPAPECAAMESDDTGSASHVLADIKTARDTLDGQVQIDSHEQFTPVGKPVEVTGVGFFDVNSPSHLPRGMGPNQLELHPIIKLTFLSDEPTDFSEPAGATFSRGRHVSPFLNPRLNNALEPVRAAHRSRHHRRP